MTVRRVLYGNGRLQKYPSHFTFVGTVQHYWNDKSVISIDITGHILRKGNRVGYLLADGFFEEEVSSLEVDKKQVQEAHPPQRVGMKTTLTRREIPVGTRVFRVGEPTPGKT